MNISAHIKLFKIKHNIKSTKLLGAVIAAVAIVAVMSVNNQNCGSKNIFDIITMIGTLYMCLQVIYMKNINHMEMSHEIYKENRDCRKDALTAMEQLVLLNDAAKTASSDKFESLYNSGAYSNLRDYAYHHEYLGNMVQKEHVDFCLLFDTATFPDGLIEKSVDLRKAGREIYPDFWNGVEYLYRTYEVKRKYNNIKQKTGSRKELKEAEKNWIDLYKKLPK